MCQEEPKRLEETKRIQKSANEYEEFQEECRQKKIELKKENEREKRDGNKKERQKKFKKMN